MWSFEGPSDTPLKGWSWLRSLYQLAIIELFSMYPYMMVTEIAILNSSREEGEPQYTS